MQIQPSEDDYPAEAETGTAAQALPDPLVPATAHPQPLSVEAALLIGLLALVWGSSFILMKRGLSYFSAPEVASIRMVAAGALMLPLALTRLRRIERRHLPYMLLSGVVGSFVPAYLFATAGKHIDSAISGALNGLSPLFTLLLGLAFFNLKTSWQGYAGILAGLAGALALSLVKAGPATSLNAWAFLVVVATLLYAININLVKYRLQQASSVTITAVALVPTGLLGTAVLVWATPFVGRIGQPGFWGVPLICCLTLGIFGSAISIILYNRLLKQVSALVASTVTYLMPVVSLGWGIWDGERVQSWQYVGLVLILAGMGLVGYANRRPRLRTV